GKTFEVLIQLGAILAIVFVYFRRLLQMACALPTDPATRRFVAAILVAFLPAAAFGALLHDFIKNGLFGTPTLVCVMLILGGFVLLAVDKMVHTVRYDDVTEIPISRTFGIGVFQCLALVPGVSRSGATIVGGLLLGADKRTAAEFSFFLAMPTMAGAFVYDLYKNYDLLTAADAKIIAAGFAAAFVAAVLVVRSLLGYVSKRGYALFGWWRIAVGALGLAALLIFG